MTVGQFEAYLGTAKKLVRHALITPETEIAWQPAPLTQKAVNPDGLRVVLAEQWRQWHDDQWDEMYLEHRKALENEVDLFLGSYFEAAWRYHHREALGMPEATLEEIAANYQVPLFATGVREVWKVLTEHAEENGPLVVWLAERWDDLPAPEDGTATTAREGCRDLERFIERYRDGGDNYRGRVAPETQATSQAWLDQPTCRPRAQQRHSSRSFFDRSKVDRLLAPNRHSGRRYRTLRETRA